MKRQIIIFFEVIFLLNTSLAAEDYYFKHYFVEDGLSNNNIECITQDNHGFIWIGTRDGLNRFDGYTFRTFRDTDEGTKTIGNNIINSLAIDAAGTLWIGTYSGLYRYNEFEENFDLIPFSEGMKISNLVFDSNENLWLKVNDKLARYDLKLKDCQIYSIPNNGILRKFCYTSDNIIWLILSNGMLYKFDISVAKFDGYDLFSHSLNIKSKDLTRIYHSVTENILFIGSTTHGAKIFDIQKNTYEDIMINEIDNKVIYISDFINVSSNVVWIASEKGLYIYNIKDKSYTLITQKQQDDYSLSTNFIKNIFKDKENGIWLGTYSGGVNYISPIQPFKKYYAYPEKNTIKGNIVHDITGDKYGNLWIATEDEGINKYDTNSDIYSHYTIQNGTHSISHKNVQGVVADDNKLWVGSSIGIDLIDIPSGNFIKNYKLGDNISVVIMSKLLNGMLLVGTSSGMYCYNKTLDRFELLQVFPSNIIIQSILEDHQGIIWAGSFNNGLYFYNPDDGTNGLFHLDSIETVNGNTINDIFEDKDFNLWFATQEGIKKYDRQTKKTTHFNVKNGLPSNITFRIESDESNNLWISTTNGLVFFNIKTQAISIFNKEHGLITNQFNYNSSWKDKDGMIYFGMVKGMISFYPADFKDFKNVARTYLTNMTIYDKVVNTKNTTIPITFSKEITLKNNQSTFGINFSSLSFIAPSIIKYAYYIEGLDDKWIYLDNSQTAFFRKLPTGDYIFKVKGSNLAGEWNDNPATLKIKVLPPWWFSNLALFVYFLLILGVLVFIIKFILKENRKKINESIKQLKYRKEKELHQSKINFFVNIAHEIKTPLTLITGSVEKINDTKNFTLKTKNYISIIEKNTKHLLRLVDQLLDFRKTEFQGYKLNYVKKDIVSLLFENTEVFKNVAEQNNLNLNITSNTEKLYVSVDEDAFAKIFSNLLLNAIKYAKFQINVSFSYNIGEFFFEIDVSNDGQPIPKQDKDKIFEPFFRGENAEFKSGTGLGLPLAKSLAEMHMGTLTLLDSNNELIIFRLHLPVNQENSFSFDETTKEANNIISTSEKKISFYNSRPTILIVEDNKEMQNFLANEINTEYNILTASNGQEALGIMSKSSIQLILSDIMMPVMDGFDFLSKVKTDLNYSHIPIIMLTAKNTQQSRLEGLELGADAYIEKPFVFNILQAQISNLLQNRNAIRSFYFKSPIANLKSIAPTKADEIFLENLNAIILEHISDPNLGVEMLAKKMNMSKPTLYRKIKAISDLTSNELIKICRLKKAAELIVQGKLSFSEISDMVGFSSLSYFSRSFSKQFGMNPTEYANENKFKR